MSAIDPLCERFVLVVTDALLPSVSALISHRVGQALGEIPADALPRDAGAAMLAARLQATALERADAEVES